MDESKTVPHWRVDKLTCLYDDIIRQEELLIGDGLTDKELQTLDYYPEIFFEVAKRVTIAFFNAYIFVMIHAFLCEVKQ